MLDVALVILPVLTSMSLPLPLPLSLYLSVSLSLSLSLSLSFSPSRSPPSRGASRRGAASSFPRAGQMAKDEAAVAMVFGAGVPCVCRGA